MIGPWSDKYKIKTGYISESKILNQEDSNKLLNWLNPKANGKNIYLKMIYRRGNDMSVYNFHSKCDNKGPTLVICKTKEQIFGGYNNFSWESTNEPKKIFQEGPFIFSINKNKKYDYFNKNFQSIYLYKNNGPDFFWDLVCHPKKEMRCCYCATRENGFAYSREPLVGDGLYKEIEIDEVEVFKVKFK